MAQADTGMEEGNEDMTKEEENILDDRRTREVTPLSLVDLGKEEMKGGNEE